MKTYDTTTPSNTLDDGVTLDVDMYMTAEEEIISHLMEQDG